MPTRPPDAPRRDPRSLPGEFWGIVAVFNPLGFASRAPNLRRFARAVRRQGLRLAIVELAYDDRPFEVGDALADIVVHVRSDAVLWQRERLLNIALGRLPASCDKVAWLDADVLFEHDAWVADTATRLEDHVVVQPWSRAVWLPPNATSTAAAGEAPDEVGMAYRMTERTDWHRTLETYQDHGHPGFAWAFRREALAHGFYDGLAAGGADVVMAHAYYHDVDFFRGRNWFSRRLPPTLLSHAAQWAAAAMPAFDRSVSFTPGTLAHLWHGDLAARQYVERMQILLDAHYDPRTDLRLNADGCWTWNSDKPELHRRLREYFAGRREDG